MESKSKIEPALYIVPTPIGNLEDITLRAVNVLKNVDIIACEDTRTSGKLLKLLEIEAHKLESYHDYNELSKSEYLIEKIKNGKSLALISDAGTPCISDPGYRLVKAAVAHSVKVIPLPGASACITALSASGLPTNEFKFLGFPPQKKGRKTFVDNLINEESTFILYESPYRILKLLSELNAILPKRQICIARELTKVFEEFSYGSVSELFDSFQTKKNIIGEFVIIVEGLKSGNKLKNI
jgi:16S rRNA (cytidine1402-2'-O)-methyltransferase